MWKPLFKTAMAYSASFVAQLALGSLLPKNTKGLAKIGITLGSIAIGGMVADAAEEWATKQFDAAKNTVEELKKVKTNLEEAEA